MSTILRALKKAEEARTRGNFSVRILSGEKAAPGGRTRALLGIGAAGLSVVLCITFFFQRVSPPSNVEVKSAAAASTPTVILPSPVGEMEPPPKPPEADFRLTGVIWDSTLPIAIINGKAVTVGEEIDGAKVLVITLNGVKLGYRDSTIFLGVQ